MKDACADELFIQAFQICYKNDNRWPPIRNLQIEMKTPEKPSVC